MRSHFGAISQLTICPLSLSPLKYKFCFCCFSIFFVFKKFICKGYMSSGIVFFFSTTLSSHFVYSTNLYLFYIFFYFCFVCNKPALILVALLVCLSSLSLFAIWKRRFVNCLLRKFGFFFIVLIFLLYAARTHACTRLSLGSVFIKCQTICLRAVSVETCF